MSFQLVIHGGAGNIPEEQKAAHREALYPIAEEGKRMLSEGRSARETVEQCVVLLENNPVFNAGYGSALNFQGTVEMDAGIMDGQALEAGAVAGVRYVQNPIDLANKVIENTEHVMLISEGAEEFAREQGVPLKDNAYFITDKRRHQWNEAQKNNSTMLEEKTEGKETKYGTVGAVARDPHGHLAAATSTGGTTNKVFGRVGDSPIIGAGVFADDETCAVSGSGTGEHFLRTSLARTVSEFVRYHQVSAQQATEQAIEYFVRKVQGDGGLITVDNAGNIGVQYSSPVMSHTIIDDSRITMGI
jgi:beta-aspartyl-peptidase (threonine type)